MIYCGKAEFGQISRSFASNSGAILLKRPKNLAQKKTEKSGSNRLSLATIDQIRQAPSIVSMLEGFFLYLTLRQQAA